MRIRRYNPTLAVTALGIGLVAGADAIHAQIPCGYEVQIIQGPFCEPFGFPPTVAKGISETGEVVGSYNSCVVGPGRAFRWTEESGVVTLEIPDGFTDSGAQDIGSATGWIVGAMTPQGQNVTTAALWIDGEAIDLGTLPGGNYSHAFAVTNGLIVGKWGNNVNGDPGIGAFLYQNGKMLNIHADLGTPNSWAWDVNADGRVCGWMGTAPQTDARAFIWDAGRVTELPPIPGGFTSEAIAMNERGDVAGVGRWVDPETGDDYPRAFLWRDGTMANLGTLLGYTNSAAIDVADTGLIIGRLWGGTDSAFIYKNRVMLDLNDLIAPESGATISIPWAIAQDGLITGQGHNQDGDVVALLLTPVQPPLGDLDMDCAVGVNDLLILLSSWGSCEDCDDCSADLDGNCTVGLADLLILLENWG